MTVIPFFTRCLLLLPQKQQQKTGLINAQPFRCNKPAAPIPEAPGGCARATPLANVQRISHGTGTGSTTVSGFWIPTIESTAAAAAAAAASGRWGLFGASALVWESRGVDDDGPRRRGRPPKNGGGLAWGPAGAATKKAAAAAAASDGLPPPEVELMELPEGVPERVGVACNTRRGVFVVRSQRVEDGMKGGTELTPSRFEALAGRWAARLFVGCVRSVW